MKKYKASVGFYEGIEIVKVISETKRFIETSMGNRLKLGRNIAYFDTWEEARDFLMCRAQANVNQSGRALNIANSRLRDIKGMTREQSEL